MVRFEFKAVKLFGSASVTVQTKLNNSGLTFLMSSDSPHRTRRQNASRLQNTSPKPGLRISKYFPQHEKLSWSWSDPSATLDLCRAGTISSKFVASQKTSMRFASRPEVPLVCSSPSKLTVAYWPLSMRGRPKERCVT